MDRFYSFRVVTYNINESDFQPLLDKAFKWAWILHDKDKTDPHIHILCTFKQNKTFKQVREMVEGKQNTFAEQMKDKYQDFLYLTHSEEYEKALYDETSIHCNDMSFFQRGLKSSVNNEEFVSDLMDKNMSLAAKIIKYGRDYARNHFTYEKVGRELRREAKLKEYIDKGLLVEEETDEFDGKKLYLVSTGELVEFRDEQLKINDKNT